MVDVQLDALAVPMRRAIYSLLLDRKASVGEIAEQVPVSRPAVSQHLKVLLAADLVRVEAEGTRRVYSADPTGMAALREWVDQMWTKAMANFAGFAPREMEDAMDSQGKGIEPVVKTVVVPGDPAVVFELFTARIGEWWPRSTHSVGGDDVDRVQFDPGVGGRVFEVSSDGTEHEWGRIIEWEPDALLRMSWYPGLSAAQATHVEITFRQTADGTEVTLVHDGWEARGESWREIRDDYDSGWDHVLGCVPGAVRGATTPV